MIGLIHEAETRLTAPEGVIYRALVVGQQRYDGMWQAWIEFQAVDGSPGLATDPEIVRPTRSSLVEWAQQLDPAHYDSALVRARSIARCPHASAVGP